MESTEKIMGDNPITKEIKEEATKNNHGEDMTQILVMEDKCNAKVDIVL